MALSQGSVRTALFALAGGPLNLRLTATNLLAVGARGRLYRRSDDGYSAVGASVALQSDGPPVVLDTPPSDLDGLEFHVRFQACAMNPAFDEGEVTLHVMQDNQYCPISRPAVWERRVPFCRDDKALRWPMILVFNASS